jgi:hypothetical protein
LLVPIVKGWCTQLGNELVALAAQVFGGMGFIEETGVAQYLRDARISTIYEGTTGIQAIDLLRRKLRRDQGEAMRQLIAEMRATARGFSSSDPDVQDIRGMMMDATERLAHSTESILELSAQDEEGALAVAVPYLELCGYAISAWVLIRLAGLGRGPRRLTDPRESAIRTRRVRFYASHILPRASALARIVTGGAASVTEADLGVLEVGVARS